MYTAVQCEVSRCTRQGLLVYTGFAKGEKVSAGKASKGEVEQEYMGRQGEQAGTDQPGADSPITKRQVLATTLAQNPFQALPGGIRHDLVAPSKPAEHPLGEVLSLALPLIRDGVACGASPRRQLHNRKRLSGPGWDWTKRRSTHERKRDAISAPLANQQPGLERREPARKGRKVLISFKSTTRAHKVTLPAITVRARSRRPRDNATIAEEGNASESAARRLGKAEQVRADAGSAREVLSSGAQQAGRLLSGLAPSLSSVRRGLTRDEIFRRTSLHCMICYGCMFWILLFPAFRGWKQLATIGNGDVR